MTGKREFEIGLVGLKPGITIFEYDLGDSFFDVEQQVEFRNSDIHVRLLIDKHTTFFQLKFEVGGQTEMVCNRCGNPLIIDLWDDFEVVLKMVDNPAEMNTQNDDPDIFFISWNESHFDVHDLINEFVQLSIPTHPNCGENEKGESKCNKDTLKVLEQLKETETKKENTIWKGLDKFRNN
jgi:uncharacterized metal-binding protein YceD (DUF177 family)